MIPPSISQELATTRVESLRAEAGRGPARRPRTRRAWLLRRAIGTTLVSAGLRIMREVA